MKTLSYTDARNGLARLMKEAEEDREAIAITRNGQSTVVLLLQEEYDAMMETLHLLSTPANAERIRRGLDDYEKGNVEVHALCD